MPVPASVPDRAQGAAPADVLELPRMGKRDRETDDNLDSEGLGTDNGHGLDLRKRAKSHRYQASSRSRRVRVRKKCCL